MRFTFIRVCLLIGCLVLASCDRQNTSAQDIRPPNDFEIGYMTMAINMKSPEFCKKISGGAQYSSKTGNKKKKIINLRSDCFFYVADLTKDKSLCDDVKEIDTPTEENKDTGHGACMAGKRSYIETQSPYVPQSLLAALKLDPDTVREQREKDPACANFSSSAHDALYRCYLRFKPDAVVDAFKAMPDFSADDALAKEDEKTEALIAAIQNNNMEDVEKALKSGADINAKRPFSEWDQTPLLAAIRADKEDNVIMTRYLLEHGADIDQADTMGNTPLSMAYRKKRLTTLSFLLKKNVAFTTVEPPTVPQPTKEQVNHFLETETYEPLP